MMDGVEVGRVNVAARACGIAIRAFELAMDYAQQRQTFGKPIAQHQAIAFKLAEMATKVEAAHLMMVNAARLKDSGERNDVEAGMAKLLASEYCAEVTQESFRIHGGYGYSKEYEIERLMREAPFLLIGEGTSEIQKTIISRGCCSREVYTGLAAGQTEPWSAIAAHLPGHVAERLTANEQQCRDRQHRSGPNRQSVALPLIGRMVVNC